MANLDHFFTCHTLVACHDAGAAQMIFDNTSENVRHRCTFMLKGPATTIFSGYASVDPEGPLLPPEVDNVVTGTGWQDKLEFRILSEAGRMGVPNIAVVDRATNFELRFSREGETVEPSTILVPEYELSKLPADSNKKNIRGFVDDSWQRQIETIRRETAKNRPLDSLFIGQPLVNDHGRPDFEIQYRFLRRWLASQASDSLTGFRPHPSDRSKLPADLCHKVALSDPNMTASEDISRASTVIGIDSFLLELSAQAGKQTFRCIEYDHQLTIEECRQ